MGYSSKFEGGPEIEDLAGKYRDEFPVTRRYTYLNHAAVAPLCRAAAEAMKWQAEDSLEHGTAHYDAWMRTCERLRVNTAALINAQPEEIALIKNTSEGIATVANGLDWKPGDKVVAFREEFPANYYPWKLLADRGVRLEWLSAMDPLDAIDEACRGARLLAISYVQYLSGYRAPLEAIGEICRRHGSLFFVDAIQGLGAFPLDVRTMGIHALAADGHKWLLGPEGCGVLYVAREVQDSIRPVEFGWTNTAHWADYASRDMTLRPDAGRYECGTLNTIGCYGLNASIEFLLQVGIGNITAAVEALSNQLAGGLSAKGYELLGPPRTPDNISGIVTFRHLNEDARATVHFLKQHGIVAAPRQGWVRASPHFYVAAEEIARMLDLLPSARN